MNEMHEGNRACWNGWAEWWSKRRDKVGVWKKCHREPSLVLSPGELQYLADAKGKSVCVLASGDNEVAFALAGMGARVTSFDISEQQLAIAERKARSLGLELSFLRADVTDLRDIPDETFHLVHTGGGVGCWISDLCAYYSEAARILKVGGIFIVNEFHPVRILFSHEEPGPLKNYSNRGPFTYTSNEGFPGTEHHWTVADRLQAMIDVGFEIVKVEEHDGTAADEDPDEVPWDDDAPVVPRYLLVVGRKQAGR
jgi:ubiquinone/menaquinone biosynthesis C-methylase UbiE